MYRFIKGNFRLLVNENSLTLKHKDNKTKEKNKEEKEYKNTEINLKIKEEKIYLWLEEGWKLLDLSFMGSNYLDAPLKRACLGMVVAICHFPLQGNNLYLTSMESGIISTLVYDLTKGIPDWLPPHINIRFVSSFSSSQIQDQEHTYMIIANARIKLKEDEIDHRKKIQDIWEEAEQNSIYRPTDTIIEYYKNLRELGPMRKLF